MLRIAILSICFRGDNPFIMSAHFWTFLTHVIYLQANILNYLPCLYNLSWQKSWKYFRWYFVQTTTSKRHFEINWPLVNHIIANHVSWNRVSGGTYSCKERRTLVAGNLLWFFCLEILILWIIIDLNYWQELRCVKNHDFWFLQLLQIVKSSIDLLQYIHCEKKNSFNA